MSRVENDRHLNLLVAPFICTDYEWLGGLSAADQLEVRLHMIRLVAAKLHNIAYNEGLFYGDDWGRILEGRLNPRWVGGVLVSLHEEWPFDRDFR